MKYSLRAETAKDKFERLGSAYEHHYKRTNGKEIKIAYVKGFVIIGESKLRISAFEKALNELKSRPDFKYPITE